MEFTEVSWWIGVAASVFVVISFLFRNIRTIRLISIVGCIVFVVYGIMINALPIWALNGFLIFVHIFNLIKLRKNKKPSHTTTPSSDGRLQKFNRDSFNKKGFKSLQWFISRDID